MDYTTCAVLRTVARKAANLKSSNGFAFGSHASFLLQLSEMSLWEMWSLPTHWIVTVGSKIEERPCHTLPSPINLTYLGGSFPMPSASKSLSLPHRVMELPSSQRLKSLGHTSLWVWAHPAPEKSLEGIADYVPLNTDTPSQESKGLTLKNSSSASSPQSTGLRRCSSETSTWTRRAVILSIRLAGM